MNTSKSLIVAALVCTACLASAAFAGEDKDKHFKKMDTNNDGQITRAEHAAGAKQMFSECDANRDGQVTAAEMDASMAKHGKQDKYEKSAAEKIQMIDKNADGQLTAAEHEAGSDQMFNMIDTDGDGSISMSEFKTGQKMKKKDS